MQLLSEQELAKKLGYDRNTLSRWRKGKKIIPVATKGKGRFTTYLYDAEHWGYLSKAVEK